MPFASSRDSLGHLEFTSDELSAIKENLKSLIITNWFERPMHSDFGCNLIEFLFENNKNLELKERIADRIISQIARWMPFVGIDELNVIFPEEDDSIPAHTIGLRIKFNLIGRTDSTAIFNFIISGQGT